MKGRGSVCEGEAEGAGRCGAVRGAGGASPGPAGAALRSAGRPRAGVQVGCAVGARKVLSRGMTGCDFHIEMIVLAALRTWMRCLVRAEGDALCGGCGG